MQAVRPVALQKLVDVSMVTSTTLKLTALSTLASIETNVDEHRATISRVQPTTHSPSSRRKRGQHRVDEM